MNANMTNNTANSPKSTPANSLLVLTYVDNGQCDSTPPNPNTGEIPLTFPLVSYIFERHDKFAICPRWVFLDPDNRLIADWSSQTISRRMTRKIKKIRKRSTPTENKTAWKNNNIWLKNVFKNGSRIHPS